VLATEYILKNNFEQNKRQRIEKMPIVNLLLYFHRLQKQIIMIWGHPIKLQLTPRFILTYKDLYN
jgi:pyridoxine/pyridoxamine 5'-phosphate oxidase